MENTISDLLLIKSFNLDKLIEDYRLFFLSIIPSVFVLACLVEYFDRMNVFDLVKRVFIAILILTSVTSFYKISIDYSIEAANQQLESQKGKNILLMDMFSAVTSWKYIDDEKKKGKFYEKKNVFWGTLSFLKYHLFSSFINDGFTLTIFFISKICFIILKVVYSLVYYLGYGLIGIPVIIYMFPTMGNVLRGGIISYLWCLTVPHVLVFVLSMIGSEINSGYQNGQIIGGSLAGTALLFVLTLFIAFTPLVTAMILNGSGVAQAGGVIATIGANAIMNLPKTVMNNGARLLTGGKMGPKMALASGFGKGSATALKKVVSGGGRAIMSGGMFSKNKEGGEHLGMQGNGKSGNVGSSEVNSVQKNQIAGGKGQNADISHISNYMKTIDRKYLNNQSHNQRGLFQKSNTVAGQKFKLENPQSVNREKKNESISKYRGRNSKSKKTTKTR